MRLFLSVAVIVLAVSINSQQQTSKSHQPRETTATDQHDTQESPIVVKVLPTPKTQEESTQESNDRKEKSANDRNLVKATYVLAGIGILQLFVFGYQALKLKETVKSAGEQAKAMERHIQEAARSATAMENIANTIDVGNKAIMRAYLTVTIGKALYQQKREGMSDLMFEARPILHNTGNTAALRLCIRIAADILPIPIPSDFGFPLPGDGEIKGNAGMVGAHQASEMPATVEKVFPDSEIVGIKEGDGRALCVWGTVTYEDIFGASHKTNFGQWLTWYPDGTIYGYYIPGQNDAD
jgi:hypothetical protein